MTNWIKHNGGPQPVAYDTWIEVEGDPWEDPESGLACGFEWHNPCRYRILNQHLIDAARREGIRLGLEAAAKEVVEWDCNPDVHAIASVISTLNPDTIAREAVLNQLTSEAQAQGMGYDKDTTR